jgi:hypothetical protein
MLGHPGLARQLALSARAAHHEGGLGVVYDLQPQAIAAKIQGKHVRELGCPKRQHSCQRRCLRDCCAEGAWGAAGPLHGCESERGSDGERSLGGTSHFGGPPQRRKRDASCGASGAASGQYLTALFCSQRHLL